MKKLLFLIILCSIITSCNTTLHRNYCKDFPEESIHYKMVLDSENMRFSYWGIAGLINDTIQGDYTVRRKRLKLYPDSGSAVLLKSKTDDSKLQFVDSNTKNAIPLVLFKVNNESYLTADANGQINLNDYSFPIKLTIEAVGYRALKLSLKSTGSWRVELVKGRNFNSENEIWKIKKNELKSKYIKLKSCNP